MPKRGTKKTSSTTETKRTATDREMEHAILRNLVELQKINTNMTEKFDQLAKEMSQLLALFELTARNFAKNAPPTEDYAKDKEFVEKIDKLLDQNKLLAKGLTMMEERMRERMYSPPQQPRRENASPEALTSRNRPMPRF
jgi:methyl coenzyme M reductase subunit D